MILSAISCITRDKESIGNEAPKEFIPGFRWIRFIFGTLLAILGTIDASDT
jgi:hypothetical protein